MRGQQYPSDHRHKERMKQRYRDRVAAGVCGKCGLRPPMAGCRSCEECQQKGRDYRRRADTCEVLASLEAGSLCALTPTPFVKPRFVAIREFGKTHVDYFEVKNP